MDIDIESGQMASWMAEILRAEFSEEENHFSYRFRYDEDHEFKLEKDKLSAELQKVNSYNEVSETVISNGNNYEIMTPHEIAKSSARLAHAMKKLKKTS